VSSIRIEVDLEYFPFLRWPVCRFLPESDELSQGPEDAVDRCPDSASDIEDVAIAAIER
jgi:hypothetical protein